MWWGVLGCGFWGFRVLGIWDLGCRLWRVLGFALTVNDLIGFRGLGFRGL